MKKHLFAVSLLIILPLFFSSCSRTVTTTIKGKVVNRNGQPIEGADIALMRAPTESEPYPPGNGTKSAADGSYSIAVLHTTSDKLNFHAGGLGAKPFKQQFNSANAPTGEYVVVLEFLF